MSKILRYWLPVGAWMALISALSTDTFNAELSRGILGSLLLSFLPDLSPETIALADTLVRKLAHLVEYFTLTLLLYRGFRQDARDGQHWRWALLSLAAAVGVATLDEIHQTLETRRSGTVLDVALDTVGALIAQGLLWGRQRHKQ